MYKFIIICLQYWFFLGDVNLCRLQPIKIPKKERQLRFPHLNPFVVTGVLAGFATTGLKIIAPSKHVQDVMLKWSSFGIPPVCSFFGLQVVEPGCCLQAVLLLCAEEDATRNSQLQSWSRRRSSRAQDSSCIHGISISSGMCFGGATINTPEEPDRQWKGPELLQIQTGTQEETEKKTTSKCLLNCRWSKRLSKRKLHL